MDESLSSFKSLEDVKLKATSNIEINGRAFEEGEIVCQFDKIQISGLQELRSYIAARGGFDNRGHVFWENTKEVQFTLSQGVFSNSQFALLSNSQVVKFEDDLILLSYIENLESDEDGMITPTYEPVDQMFIYDKNTGEKYAVASWPNNQFKLPAAYLEVVVSYRYRYTGGGSVAYIGRPLGGFLELEGKTRVKDDTSGLITTGILKIPKLKLMSGLSIRLGKQANPVVGSFSAVGVPVGERRDSYVCELLFLNNDIDSDM